MRISSSDQIAGQPILAIRKLLKSGGDYSWTIDHVCSKLNVDQNTAWQVISQLVADGYVERDEKFGDEYWQNTTKGFALANASAAKPIKREVAQKHLDSFLDRVRAINSNAALPYVVTKVILFGSFLTDAPTVSDVDIAVQLRHRVADYEQFEALENQRVAAALERGRQLNDYFSQLIWPYQEVLLMLKNRSRVISLHDVDHHEKLFETEQHRVIYSADQVAG